MDRTVEELRLDGNAAAGSLGELLAFDVTTAIAVCDGCGSSSPVGALLLYDQAMGTVLRCPGCAHLMLCATQIRGVVRLDLRGTRSLRVDLGPR
jgi:hypothetical protein